MIDDSTATQPGPAPRATEVAYPERCGRYEVLGPLGAGGMGIVLEGRDPVLDRKVALKLLRPRAGGTATAGAAQLAAEVQAMARLAHPNVVAVYEIDRVGEQAYVAMELVAGTTLRGWLGERARRWPEIVAMFVAAGRGLAAAHAAGLVHRDVKPDNVLIGRDGRPRVSDFGLVAELASAAELDELAARDRDTTFRGSAAGTPAYMSPEQWTGRPVDPRSDQFAFCAALWEAVCDCHPFASDPSDRAVELRARVTAGAIALPGSRRRVPRWLLAVLRRGLAADPQARWPDMTALLDALARRTRSHRRWTLAAVAAAVALGSAAIATWLVSTPAPDPCAPPTARLAAVWSPARAAAIRAQLVAVDPAQGAARFAKVAAALDTRAEAFSAMHVAACRATRVDGRQPDAVLDRRMQCLDRWLVELDDTAAVIAQATDLPAVDRAAYAAIAMPPVDACGDRAAAGPPLPAGAAERATAIALANRTAEIAVARRADRLEGIERETAELVAAARALGHAPTLVGALVVQVRVLLELSNRAATEPILHELVELAPRVGDDRAEAFAWLHLATVTLLARGKYDDAVALFPSARAAVLRAGDPIDLHAEQLYDEGIVLDRGPTPVQGRAKLREARALLERAGAAAPSSPLAEHLSDVLDETATSYIYTDELDAAIAAYHEAMAQRRAIFDTGSAQEAYVWNNLASALEQAGRLDEALDAAREAVRIRETRVGESVALANSLNTLADAMSELGQSRESLPFYERALRMSQAKRPPGDIRLAPLYLGYAHALAGVRRYDEATRYYGESVALFDKTGAKNLNLPITLTHRGELAALRGRCAEALPDYARAIALVEQLSGPTSSWMVGPLTGQAACLVQGERPGDAIPVLRRALGCKTNAGQKAQLAVAMSWLGRALVESRRDVHGGLAMARTARAALATAPGAADDLAVLDRWLAAHAR